MPDKLIAADFSPHLNQPFMMRPPNAEMLELELVSVAELGAPLPADSRFRRAFSLHFLGPLSDRYWPQSTYRVEHPVLGALDVFLVPLGPEPTDGKENSFARRMRYEAIFG